MLITRLVPTRNHGQSALSISLFLFPNPGPSKPLSYPAKGVTEPPSGLGIHVPEALEGSQHLDLAAIDDEAPTADERPRSNRLKRRWKPVAEDGPRLSSASPTRHPLHTASLGDCISPEAVFKQRNLQASQEDQDASPVRADVQVLRESQVIDPTRVLEPALLARERDEPSPTGNAFEPALIPPEVGSPPDGGRWSSRTMRHPLLRHSSTSSTYTKATATLARPRSASHGAAKKQLKPVPMAACGGKPLELKFINELKNAAYEWTSAEQSVQRRLIRVRRRRTGSIIEVEWDILDQEQYNRISSMLSRSQGREVSAIGGGGVDSRRFPHGRPKQASTMSQADQAADQGKHQATKMDAAPTSDEGAWADRLTVVSCIFWRDRGDCVLTSVELLYLIEEVLGRPISMEEKNRIRRKLE